LYNNTGHNCFLSHTSQFMIPIQHYKTCMLDKASLHELRCNKKFCDFTEPECS